MKKEKYWQTTNLQNLINMNQSQIQRNSAQTTVKFGGLTLLANTENTPAATSWQHMNKQKCSHSSTLGFF
jgi:hypothetical protein